MKRNEPTILSRYNDENNSLNPYSTLPDRAIADLDKQGRPRMTKINFAPTVAINRDKVIQGIDYIEKSPLYDPKKWCEYEHLVRLLQIKDALNNTIDPNFYLQLYREGTFGRLYPESNTNFPNIISMPKVIRNLIFSGMDLYDYDISNCVYSIFLGLCEKFGFDAPHIRFYVENKSECRKE